MKQFDVCEARGAGVGRRSQLVVVLQHEHLVDIGTVVVAPLFAANALPYIERVRVRAKIGRSSHVVAVDRLVAIPRQQLLPTQHSLEAHRYELKTALDMLFSGF